MATEQHKPRRGRGGRQYDLKRVRTTDLAPGLRTVLSEFERAARDHEFKGAAPPDEWEDIERYYDRRKQALIRKLLRLQNGEEYTDVEQLKRQLRRMARVLAQISEIVSSSEPSIYMPGTLRDLLKAQPNVMADVERIIAQRRSW